MIPFYFLNHLSWLEGVGSLDNWHLIEERCIKGQVCRTFVLAFDFFFFSFFATWFSLDREPTVTLNNLCQQPHLISQPCPCLCLTRVAGDPVCLRLNGSWWGSHLSLCRLFARTRWLSWSSSGFVFHELGSSALSAHTAEKSMAWRICMYYSLVMMDGSCSVCWNLLGCWDLKPVVQILIPIMKSSLRYLSVGDVLLCSINISTTQVIQLYNRLKSHTSNILP